MALLAKETKRPQPGGRLIWIAVVASMVLACVFRTSAQVITKSEVESGEIRTLPSRDADKLQLSPDRNDSALAAKNLGKDETCLLPPLNLSSAGAVSARQLQVPGNARKEYQQACTALNDKKIADAEKHLRKAVQLYPKYSAAWVTLGQMLAAQKKTNDARAACSQGSVADGGYTPAYLCLADIAVRAHNWDEVLNLSNRALELDPSGNAVAYEYNAAANLHVHNLADAEKSGLRAEEIDKNHLEPRVFFVVAQIYEAKHDPTNEAAQLRQYLKYAKDPDDVAMVQQYLSELEKQPVK